METRLQQLEGRLKYLEDRVRSQDAVIRERDRTIERLRDPEAQVRGDAPQADTGRWFERVEVGGLVEVEAGATDAYVDADDSSDIVLATVELGLAAQVTPWVGAEVLLLHEEDDTDLEVDVGLVTIAPPDGPWALTGGQFYVPFGTFETHMVSDPLTLELGETRESSLLAGFESAGLFAGAYVFNGENDTDGDDDTSNWGASAGYAGGGDGFAFSGQAGYLSDLGDSDAVQDTIAGNLDAMAGGDAAAQGRLTAVQGRRDDVDAWFASALLTTGRLTFIVEYLAASDHFLANELADGLGRAEPAAWNLEAGVGFELAGRESTFALAYQGTDDALALGLPEERILAGLSVALFDDTSLSFEWAHDEDYSVADGGTGNDADTFTAQVAVEF